MKFDPKTFQPFEKILVRDYNSDVWKSMSGSRMPR